MSNHYWLSTKNQGLFRTLNIFPKGNENSETKDLDGELWFTEDEKDEADRFAMEVRCYLRYLYCYKYKHIDRATWMDNNDWVRNGSDK